MRDVDPQFYPSAIREMLRHENDVTNHRIMWFSKRPAPVILAKAIALFMVASNALAQTDSAFVRLDPANTTSGYLARLLINEVPFPGERAYVSEAETQGAMVEILGVLHSRLRSIPTGYRQEHVAGVRSTNIIDIICGTGEKRQCEGFYRNASGQFVTAPRVEERLNYLIKLSNSGGKPGRFANLLNFGQDLARAYVKEGIAGADRYARIARIGQTPVTGYAYSWMTDVDSFHPGGNYVSIPNSEEGSLGGNRFFTLRKTPK